MEDKKVLTDEQLWQLCIEEENKKKIILHDRNEDKAVDYEFWQLIYSRDKDLK
jgi:hypothetical protein